MPLHRAICGDCRANHHSEKCLFFWASAAKRAKHLPRVIPIRSPAVTAAGLRVVTMANYRQWTTNYICQSIGHIAGPQHVAGETKWNIVGSTWAAWTTGELFGLSRRFSQKGGPLKSANAAVHLRTCPLRTLQSAHWSLETWSRTEDTCARASRTKLRY